MAYLRLSETKKYGEGIDVFVNTMMKSFSRQVAIRNADDEATFQRSVLAEDLPLQSQLDYRQEQLKRVFDDPDERRRIRSEIASLKDRIQQKKFSDAYVQKLTDNAAGITSLESVISWLKDYKATETDATVLSSINQALYQKESERFSLVQTLLKNQTDYALQDKTAEVLNNQIARVSNARSSALLSGNNELVSVYDLQLQSLNKALKESSVGNSIKDFAVSTLSGHSSATNLLDSYNQKIASASTNGLVTIDGTSFASEREYWTYKRDSYLADTTSSGFFPRYKTENSDAMKAKNSQNSLAVSDIRSVGAGYDTLLARPELSAYVQKITTEKQGVMQTAADFMTDSITNKYSTNYDLPNAVSRLDAVKALGVNTEDAYTKIINAAATIKSTQASELMKSINEARLNNPNATIEELVKAASAKGGTSILSPEQLATKTPEQIATESFNAQQKGTFGSDTRTTAQGAAQNVPPVVPPQPAPQNPPASPTPVPVVPFTRQLDLGASGADVKALQQFLNKQGYAVASQGQPGSAGFETEYFGPATQAALKKFQTAQGIVSEGDAATTGFGRVGPQTLAKLTELYK